MRNLQPKTILIVEHDEVHQTYINKYFDENRDISVIIKENIASAISYLETIHREPLSMPGLLLVNYRTLMNDSQVLLGELKKRNLRAYIPVIALSDTDDRNLVEEAYQTHGVASYLVKPGAAEEWDSLFSILTRYWFNEVTLPNYSLARHG